MGSREEKIRSIPCLFLVVGVVIVFQLFVVKYSRILNDDKYGWNFHSESNDHFVLRKIFVILGCSLLAGSNLSNY